MFCFIKSKKNSISNITTKICIVMFMLVGKSYGDVVIVPGESFQVNAQIENNQHRSKVSCLNNGYFVVVWESTGQDPGEEEWHSGIYCQIFDVSGTKIGSEFMVNSYTAGYQAVPAVDSLSGGGFVITWESNSQDGEYYGVFGQVFDSAGNKIGTEFQANTYTADRQEDSCVKGLSNGNFVVAWSSNNQDSDEWGSYGQIFNSSGDRIGNEFQINSYESGTQAFPDIGLFSDGNFVVTWSSNAQDGSEYGVYGQIFDPSGAKIGSEFQLNTFVTEDQFFTSVAVLNNDNFVVTWRSLDQDGHGYGVYGQIFSPLGVKIGNEFQVNTYTTGDQWISSISLFSNDQFLVVWEVYGGSQDINPKGSAIYGQIFNENGEKIGAEIQLNPDEDRFYRLPDHASFSNGRFVVVWQSYDDEISIGVFGRVFESYSCQSEGLCALHTGQILHYVEDIPKEFKPIVIFSNILNVNVTMSLNKTVGSINEHLLANAQSTFDSNLGKWHSWGSVDGINELFVDLIFTPSFHYSDDFAIDVLVTNGNETILDTIGVFGTSGHPVVNGNIEPMEYICADGANIIDDAIVITDPNHNALQRAMVKMINGANFSLDSLGFVDQNGIIGSYNDTTGALTLNGTSHISNYQDALQSITYEHGDLSLPTNTITVSFVVNDGIYDSDAFMRNIVFDSPPHLIHESSLSYIEDIPSVFYLGVYSVSCSANVTVSLSDSSAGSFAQGTADGASSIFNQNLGKWEAFGNVNGVNALLGNLQFTPSLHYREDFNLNVFIKDDVSNATETISIVGVPGNPVVSTTQRSLQFNCVSGPQVIDAALNVTDPNSNSLQSATVQISNDFNVEGLVLGFDNQNGILGYYSNGELLLEGDDNTVADYEAALRSVTYEYSGNSFPDVPIPIFFKVNDGIYDSNIAFRSINFTDNCASSSSEFPPWAWGIIGAGTAAVLFVGSAVISVVIFGVIKQKSFSGEKSTLSDFEMYNAE